MRESLTPAQRRVRLAVRTVLGAAYQVDWLGTSPTADAHVLLLLHIESRRALALLFRDIQRCDRPVFEDYMGSIASTDRRAVEVALAAVSDPHGARALIGEEEPGGTTGLHAILDAALAALAAAEPELAAGT